MQQANKQGIKGVALIAYFDGEEIQSWQSKMIVTVNAKIHRCGKPGCKPSCHSLRKGAEADTQPSGSADELDDRRIWMVRKCDSKGKHGYWIAAFSVEIGDDVNVSNRGLDAICKALRVPFVSLHDREIDHRVCSE